MDKNSFPVNWFMVGLSLLLLTTISCQLGNSLDLTDPRAPTPTPKQWPYSSFTPPYKSIDIPVGQPVQINSYHASVSRLDKIEAFVNGQPLGQGVMFAPSRDCPSGLIYAQFQGDDQAPAIVFSPERPTTEKKVALEWIGCIPGSYELRLMVTDADGRRGQPISQQIEVTPGSP